MKKGRLITNAFFPKALKPGLVPVGKQV